jgi:hypothetical protein
MHWLTEDPFRVIHRYLDDSHLVSRPELEGRPGKRNYRQKLKLPEALRRGSGATLLTRRDGNS